MQQQRKSSLDTLKEKSSKLIEIGGKSSANNVGNTSIRSIEQRKEALTNIKNNLASQRRNLDNALVSSNNSSSDLTKKIQQYSYHIIKEVDENLKKQSLELVFVIDKSASCSGTESDTIIGFDRLIKAEKKKGYNVSVSVDLFDISENLIYNCEPIKNVRTFEYCANGNATSLYDCLSKRITEIKNKHINDGNPDKETLFVIMTDGLDNHSNLNEYQIRAMVEERIKAGWKFILLGALKYEDSVKDYAERLGIQKNYAQLYLKECVSTNFEAIESVITDLQMTGEINPNWDDVIKKATENNKANRIETGSKQLKIERKKF